jgi:hypothetical protein
VVILVDEDESDSDEEYEVEHIPRNISTNTRTNNTPTIVKSSSSHFAQKNVAVEYHIQDSMLKVLNANVT